MTQYQSTPDYYRDYIEHGWLKDQAAKAHKYIERWRGKNGKWYYRYKSKAQEARADLNRKFYNIWNPNNYMYVGKKKADVVSTDNGKWVHSIDAGNGKANSRSGRTGSKSVKTTKVSSKVSRSPKKKGNITSRGYSGSQGSGESKRQRNLGTRKSNNLNTKRKRYSLEYLRESAYNSKKNKW